MKLMQGPKVKVYQVSGPILLNLTEPYSSGGITIIQRPTTSFEKNDWYPEIGDVVVGLHKNAAQMFIDHLTNLL